MKLILFFLFVFACVCVLIAPYTYLLIIAFKIYGIDVGETSFSEINY